jgi:glutamine synthetase
MYHGSYDDGRRGGYESLVPTTLARADYTIQAGDRYEGFFSRVRDGLAASNLGPWTSQVEWGLGQWEINLEYRDALEMADRHMLFKLAMRAFAASEGMAVTFMARPFGDTTGSSCHLHLSLVDGDGRTCSHDDEPSRISATLRHAIGGVLERAPELMVFYAPTVNSYRRRQRRVLGQRPVVGVRQPDGLVPRARRVARVHPARMARAGRRREPVPRDRGAARVGARRDRDRDRPRRAADGPRLRPAVRPLPTTLGEAVERLPRRRVRGDAFGKDVVAHYAEAGRWEWERFLAADASPNGSAGATSTSSEEANAWRAAGGDEDRTRRAREHGQPPGILREEAFAKPGCGRALHDRAGRHERLAPPRRGRHDRVRAVGDRRDRVRRGHGESAARASSW